MPKNHDFDVSRITGFDDEPVLESNFGPILIFWGPRQLDTGFSNYNSPSLNDWRHLDPMAILQVIRYHHNGDTSYDTDQFDDDDGGGTPTLYDWVVVNYSYNATPPGIIFVVWRNVLTTLQQNCSTGLIFSPTNLAIVQGSFPLGLVRQSTSSVFPCGDVMGP